MDIRTFFGENEKPLERLLPDGGFCGIFRTIGCIGDSLSSGEFQTKKDEETFRYTDMYEYSWGQYMARTLGSKVYNFSRGGMTAKWYMDTFANDRGFWNPSLACQAYIIALGVNDVAKEHPMGSLEDIKPDWRDNEDTYTGNYAAIIQRLKEIQPNAKFFLMSSPQWEGNDSLNAKYAVLSEKIRDLSNHFENCYFMDFFTYSPPIDDLYRQKFWLNRHQAPTGYILSAKMIMSYMDYIIRHNMEDFKMVGFTGREKLLEQPEAYQPIY